MRRLCAEHDLRHLGVPRRGGADDEYLAAAAGLAGSVTRTGRLEHHELAPLLAACTAQVVPSTFPEAFGMVAAEAAAAGALPIVAAHSGLDEVATTLAPGLPPAARELLRFASARRPSATSPPGWSRGWRWSVRSSTAVRASLVGTARRLFGWDGVAAGVIAAAQGRHDDLAPLP